MAKDKIAMTTVIRDTRDASYDYQLPLERARQLYAEGKLQLDVTNEKYCHPTNNPHQPKLQ